MVLAGKQQSGLSISLEPEFGVLVECPALAGRMCSFRRCAICGSAGCGRMVTIHKTVLVSESALFQHCILSSSTSRVSGSSKTADVLSLPSRGRPGLSSQWPNQLLLPAHVRA